MKQATTLLALLVTTSLSAGCGRCDKPEIAIYWIFTDATGQSTNSCGAAGVATIRIFVNDVAQLDAAGRQDLVCAALGGGAFVPAQTENDRVQVEAYDASGTLLYLAHDSVVTQSCGVTRHDAILTAEQGSLTVNLAGLAQCPTSSYVWYSLTDVTDPARPAIYSIVDSLHGNATSIPCSGALAFDAVPFGTYRLDFIQIVHPTSSAPGATYVADYQNCTPQIITHAANDAATVTLAPATTQCVP